jgi:predicted transcriptional regulator
MTIKAVSFENLDEDSKAIVHGLMRIKNADGKQLFSAIESAILTYMLTHDDVTSFEIEQTFPQICQPEVSMTLKKFMEAGWIHVDEFKAEEERGRPTKIYNLVVTIDQIFEGTREIEDMREKVYGKYYDDLKKLASPLAKGMS